VNPPQGKGNVISAWPPGSARPCGQLTEGRQVEVGAGKEGDGEALAPDFAVTVVGMHAVDQPGPAAWLASQQRGQRHALVTAAGYPHR
jgi:hypothetical protein